MITKEQVLEALKNCYDPEIPINIVDMGLIYGVDVNNEEGKVHIKMTLTGQGCPAHGMMSEDAQSCVLASVEGAKECVVEVVWDPPWHPRMMSTEAKQQLGIPEEEETPPPSSTQS
jgi:metal-sulfur cluster biosynthetic enzyme